MNGMTLTPDGKVTDLLSNYSVAPETLAGCVRTLCQQGALDVLPMLVQGVRS